MDEGRVNIEYSQFEKYMGGPPEDLTRTSLEFSSNGLVQNSDIDVRGKWGVFS